MFRSKRRNLHWGDLNMADLYLDKLILHFAQSNKAEGKSPKTITWYTEMITGFTRFLTGTGRRPVLAESCITEQRSFIKSFVERIDMDDLKAKVYYTIPMPPSSTPQETVGVSPFVHHGEKRGGGNREEGLRPSLTLLLWRSFLKRRGRNSGKRGGRLVGAFQGKKPP